MRILLHWMVILSKFERETKITNHFVLESIIMHHCSVVAGVVSEGIVSEVLSEGSVSEVLPEGLVSEVVSEGSVSEVVPR